METNIQLIENPQFDLYKSLFDSNTDVSYALDLNGFFIYANEAAITLSGYSKEELLHMNFPAVLKTEDIERSYHYFENVKKGNIQKFDLSFRTKSGDVVDLYITVAPIVMDEKIQGIIGTGKNMTGNLQIQQIKNEFHQTITSLYNGIFKVKKNEAGKFIYTMSEGQLLKELGLCSNVLANKGPEDVFTQDIAKLKLANYEMAFNGKRVSYEIKLGGKVLLVELVPIFQKNMVIEMVGSVHDVTELYSMKRKLQENQLLYSSLFDHIDSSVISYDTKGRIINMNPKTEEMTGYSVDYLMSNMTLPTIIDPDFREVRKQFFQKALQGEPQNFDCAIYNKAGERIHLNVTYIPIIIDQKIEFVYSIAKDITKQKNRHELNAYLARHDELTKLANRRWLEETLRESLSNAKDQNQRLAVMYLDLDRFKNINDTLGHCVGDALLVEVAERFQKNLLPHQFLARMGGDEFMILSPILENGEEITQTARNLLSSIREPIVIEGNELIITSSIGISLFPNDGDNVVELMKYADIALYRAKDQGGDSYEIYSSSMNTMNQQNLQLERDLRKAVVNNEFIIHYQPRVNGRTGKITSLEALIRWNHPLLGQVPPSKFIPLAEETGVIVPIGRWMKRKVCEQLVQWREEGKPLIPISVNISARHFAQKDFIDRLRVLLETYQLEGKWLEIEITENSMAKNEQQVIQTLNELKELGIRVYIDDFGTGYSSFSYLKAFQIDGIKIDYSFIHDISCQSENAGITIAMITMAKHLKLDVIAEGVETLEEFLFLREQGCHHIQGYLFSEPCPIEEIDLVSGTIVDNCG